MIETRILYEVKLNGYKLNVTQGMLVVKKLQEPLDEGALNVPITVRDIEYEMFGFLSIKIIGKSKKKEVTYFIQNDEVEPLTKDGIYTHNLTLIEYTYSYDTKLVKALTFTQNQVYNKDAQFYNNIPKVGGLYNQANRDFWIPPIKLKERFTIGQGNFIVPQCIQAYQNIASSVFRRDVFIRIYNPNNITYSTSQRRYVPNGVFSKETILSSEAFEYAPTMDGIHLIEYGVVNLFNGEVADPRAVVFTFTLNFIAEVKYTLYDYVDRIRRVVPLETKMYHEQTRLFNLDESLVERFKSIVMPQMFITQMTLRQTLNTLFKFINAIMRLEYVEDELDNLTIDEFNKVIGSFELTQMVDFKTSQNIQGYGTKITSWLENTVQANFRDNPTISTPASNYFKTVRAQNVQLVEGQNGFYLPLDSSDIYEMGKLTVQIPKVTYGGYSIGNPNPLTTVLNFELDLSGRFVPIEEWNLKRPTNDFPDYAVEEIFSARVGMRENQGGNIYWERGKNYISFSKEFGRWFSDVLIVQVVKEQLAEYFTMNPPLSFFSNGTFDQQMGFDVEYIDLDWFYRNISFNVEYTTLKSITVKNHRHDISVINKETEIRLNQSARITDFKLATKNAVGYLERMGVPNKEFTRIHTDVESLLDVAMKDDDGYVITQATYELNNDYIVGKYELTKDHIRLSEFMGIDRAFRAFSIPRNDQVYDRDEHYEDFIMVDRLDSQMLPQSVLFNRFFVINAFKNLTATDLGKNKITYAFVRTDGFSKRYKDEAGYYKAIMTPVGAYGGEQALLFNFGFNSNIVAGDAIEKVGSNYYNDPIRYTDDLGRFEELWFAFGDIYFSTANFPPIGGTTETVFNKTYAYPLIQSASNTFNQSFLVTTGVVGTSSYNPIIFSKDPSEVLRSMNYQVNIIPVNYRDYVVGTTFFSKNRLVLNVTSIDRLWLYKYKDGTTHDMFDTLMAKTNATLYNYDKIEIIRGSIGINIVFVENVDGTREVRLINNAVMGSNHTSWAIANDLGELLFACNVKENGFKLIPRHFRPGIDPLSLQRDGNYDVDLIDILQINASYDINKFEFPSVGLSSVLTIGASYNILRSTDTEVDLNSVLTLNASYDVVKFEFPLVNLTESISLGASYDIVQSTDFVQGLSETLSLNASFQVLKTENQVANFTDTLSVGASFNLVKTEKYWSYIALVPEAYDGDVTYTSTSCPTQAQTLAWLNSNYPPMTMASGFVMRVQRAVFGGSPICFPEYYYFEIINNA